MNKIIAKNNLLERLNLEMIYWTVIHLFICVWKKTITSQENQSIQFNLLLSQSALLHAKRYKPYIRSFVVM